MAYAIFVFIEHLFYALMFAGNGYFVFTHGVSTLFSSFSASEHHLGLAMGLVQMIYFAPGAYKFVDGFFKWKYTGRP
jgi:hypothetical protein